MAEAGKEFPGSYRICGKVAVKFSRENQNAPHGYGCGTTDIGSRVIADHDNFFGRKTEGGKCSPEKCRGGFSKKCCRHTCGKLQCGDKCSCGEEETVTSLKVAVMFEGKKFGMVAHQYPESRDEHLIGQNITQIADQNMCGIRIGGVNARLTKFCSGIGASEEPAGRGSRVAEIRNRGHERGKDPCNRNVHPEPRKAGLNGLPAPVGVVGDEPERNAAVLQFLQRRNCSRNRFSVNIDNTVKIDQKPRNRHMNISIGERKRK